MRKVESDNLSSRKEKVNKLVAEKEKQGYRVNDISVDGDKANLTSLITGGIPSLAFILLFGFVFGWDKYTQIQFIYLIVGFVLSIIVHEIIHGFFFGLFAKKHFESIEFGFLWRSLNPYCYCAEPLNKVQYMISLLMPAFILGFCFSAAGMITGNATLIAFGVMNFFLAGGDIYIVYLILVFSRRDREEYYIDHPDKPGVLVLVKE